MGQTRGVFYLHEPRYIWCYLNPRLDVWAYRRPLGEGKLFWNADNLHPGEAARLARWFHLELTLSGRRRLVEKTPLNVFRLRWLSAMFPTAKFVHVIRHGRDTALSIAAAQAKWFPQGYWESSRHYGIFRDYAAGVPELWNSLGYIAENMDNYARGLLVWLCSVTEGRQAGHELGPDKYLEVRYETLVSEPRELRRIFDFIAEPWPESTIQHARNVLRTDSMHKPNPNPSLTAAITGDLLDELGYKVCD